MRSEKFTTCKQQRQAKQAQCQHNMALLAVVDDARAAAPSVLRSELSCCTTAVDPGKSAVAGAGRNPDTASPAVAAAASVGTATAGVTAIVMAQADAVTFPHLASAAAHLLSKTGVTLAQQPMEGHEGLEGHQPAGVVHTLCQLVNDKVHCCAR